jgi:class 3 adenylate cyclase
MEVKPAGISTCGRCWPTFQAPTLVMHRAKDRLVPLEFGRQLAEQIPGARFLELAGKDHMPWFGDQDAILDPLEEFLVGRHETEVDPDRVLATVPFTDIVGSTKMAASLGDGGWRKLLDEHDEVVVRELDAWRGRLVKNTGDGIFATFDGPIRAILCAEHLRRQLSSLGLEIRAGIHTGEVEMRGEDIGGMAVHIGARVGSLAGAGEVLVSRTVVDLVSGSGLDFADRGTHALKGAPGEWTLYAVC